MNRTILIKATQERIPGGYMVVPLGLECLLANVAPRGPKFLGSFSGALFGNPLPILAVFSVCIGATPVNAPIARWRPSADFARNGLPFRLPPVGLPL